MTNSQCIEVVEKVWGWEHTYDPKVPYPTHFFKSPNNDSFIGIERFKEQLNSWTGFGRTVEAMAERGIQFKQLMQMTGLHGGSVIEAAHLVALEAIKDE